MRPKVPLPTGTEIGAPGQMRPDVVGDHEIHDDDRAAEDQVEVPGDPLRVVNGAVELVAHVDDPAGAAEAEHDERERKHDHADRGCAGNVVLIQLDDNEQGRDL